MFAITSHRKAPVEIHEPEPGDEDREPHDVQVEHGYSEVLEIGNAEIRQDQGQDQRREIGGGEEYEQEPGLNLLLVHPRPQVPSDEHRHGRDIRGNADEDVETHPRVSGVENPEPFAVPLFETGEDEEIDEVGDGENGPREVV